LSSNNAKINFGSRVLKLFVHNISSAEAKESFSVGVER